MKVSNTWSTERYRPAVHPDDEVYILQIIPGTDSVTLHYQGGTGKTVALIRPKGCEESWTECDADEREVTFTGLQPELDYEFFIRKEKGISAVGYARPGFAPGIVVNYLHPEDPKYSFSGQHLCTPSLLKLPSGALLASMDLFDGKAPQNLTLIFRSDDGGNNWYHRSEVFPCFWGALFYHHGAVYLLSVSTEHGDLLIGKSEDEGKTFCIPTVLWRGSSHFAAPGWHKSGMPVIEHGGRLWTGIDYGAHKTGGYANCLLSVPADADLLDASNWSVTEPLSYRSDWKGAVVGDNRGFLEGNAVILPDGGIGNLLRYSTDKGTPNHGYAALLRGSLTEPERKLEFDHFVPFPGNLSKFDVRQDPDTGLYFTICSRNYREDCVTARNVLALACSTNLDRWTVLCDLLDYPDTDPKLVGFQYVSFCFDGEDLIYLSRTAINGAQSFHDNNYITFHRVPSFRNLIKAEIM